jgi:hypothetical protein
MADQEKCIRPEFPPEPPPPPVSEVFRESGSSPISPAT